MPPRNATAVVLLGFTLAEVLVTLGVIGVVSAMTIPTLMKNHQKKVYVTQLHKFYNNLSDALDLYMTDNNLMNLREGGKTPAMNLFTTYFKIVKTCPNPDLSGCFGATYKTLDGTEKSIGTAATYAAVLADGTAVTAYPACIANTSECANQPVCYYYVDTNGPNPPNILGRDIFTMYVKQDGQVYYYNYNGTLDSTGSNAFGKILDDNWQMNY